MGTHWELCFQKALFHSIFLPVHSSRPGMMAQSSPDSRTCLLCRSGFTLSYWIHLTSLITSSLGCNMGIILKPDLQGVREPSLCMD